MLAHFDGISGTSSSELFDIMLKRGREDHLARHPKESELFRNLVQHIDLFAHKAVTEGSAEKSVTGRRPFNQYRARPLDSLSTLEERFAGGAEYGRRLFTLNLGHTLLIEAWDFMVSSAKSDDIKLKVRKFFDDMYLMCTGRDRQFGYAGRRGSVVNLLLLSASAEYPDMADCGRQAIALLEVLREAVRNVTGREEFWPYSVDSKSFNGALKP